jgi:hypothetical protein
MNLDAHFVAGAINREISSITRNYDERVHKKVETCDRSGESLAPNMNRARAIG